ncbi:ArnT family glycosyltransferase [Paenibacillus chartarius]|uniref:ArnT family glycosyltransferase n=1 Tax=Paenibacillus chartarius TaxID=747481 RepID=A0ABV6DKJ2_9BACL
MSFRRVASCWPSVLLAVIVAVGCYLRLRFVMRMEYGPESLIGDQTEYIRLAIQLLEKGIYAYRDTTPNTMVTPGWPMIVAGFFKLFGYEPLERTLMIIRVWQCFFALPALWFIYAIGKRLFGPLTGLLAAGFAAVYPPYVYSASLILTEVPFLTFFTALLYAQTRVLQGGGRRDHGIAGMLLGICVLIRPNVLPLGVVPYVLLYVQDKRAEWRGALAAAACFTLVMLPWWVRNWVTFHEFIPIAKGEVGNPFLGGTDPYFRGTIDWSRINEKEQFQEGLRRIQAGLREDPWLWIRWMTAGKFFIFFKSMWVGDYPGTVPGWYYAAMVRLHRYIVVIGWVAAALLTPWIRPFRFPVLTLLTFLAVHMIFIPVNRYAYGMMPMLMLLTAHFAVQGGMLAWTAGKGAGRLVAQRR